jgi:murein DD-endopeptidase MepM/ murein hydrolase activator NlpD
MHRFSSQQNGRRKGATARSALWASAVVVVVAGAACGGFWYGQWSTPQLTVPTETVAELEAMFEQERKTLDEAKQESGAQLDAFAGRVGAMQAEILRLNALGERLVEMADLDAEEFDFENPPPIGGPDDDTLASKQTSLSELMGDMTNMRGVISDRQRKLAELETAIMERDLKKHATPSGWPVRSGYITSKFGYRKHPIYRKAKFHAGVDFAGKRGAPVLATADGVVTFSGWQSGYGRLVEIRHMDGLKTRYGHNQKNLVKEGDMVKKGQTIAKLGSTGRSTGPHVHFEVRKNGAAVNPLKYVGNKKPKAVKSLKYVGNKKSEQSG